MRICVLGSGSRGNCIFVASSSPRPSRGQTKLLFDCGLSAAAVESRLAQIGEKASALTAIVLSHEHGDHTRGVRILAKKYGLPVYANPGTLKACPEITCPESRRDGAGPIQLFESNSPFKINDLRIEGFPVCHDAEEPVAFTVSNGEWKLGLALDLGLVTGLICQRLAGCHVLVLEFNHDLEMLLNGPYPWELKQRVKGGRGHLSNEQAARLLSEVGHNDLRWVVLAHLSEVNNRPLKALKEAEEVIRKKGLGRVRLSLSTQRRVGEVIFLD